MRILFGIAAASLCGTVFAQSPASSPTLSYEVSTNLFTLPVEAAERLGLAPREGETGTQMVLAPDDFRNLAEKLKKVEGYKAFRAAKVATPPESPVTVEQTREFNYPTAYEPTASRTLPDGSRVKSVLSPTTFETRNVGLTLSFLLRQAPADRIDLEVKADLVSFTGWAAYSHGKTAATKAESAPEAGFRLPVFAIGRSTSTYCIRSGETVLMGGHPLLSEQDVNDAIALKGDQGPVRPAQLRFIAISATATDSAPAIREIVQAAPIQVSAKLVSIPRSKAPKGFLSATRLTEDAFRMRILDAGAAESLQQLWSKADMEAKIFEGPKMTLTPTDLYAVDAAGILAYARKNEKAAPTREKIRLELQAKGKVETPSVIGLTVDTHLLKEQTTGAAEPIQWKVATGTASNRESPGRISAQRNVSLGNDQTLLLVNESTTHPDQVLFLFVKASAPIK